MVNMLVLFGNFYRQSYRKKPVPAASKAKETESKTKEDPQVCSLCFDALSPVLISLSKGAFASMLLA